MKTRIETDRIIRQVRQLNIQLNHLVDNNNNYSSIEITYDEDKESFYIKTDWEGKIETKVVNVYADSVELAIAELVRELILLPKFN
jgi:hypothetical protein